jgi:UDP-glucose 4-epimerase
MNFAANEPDGETYKLVGQNGRLQEVVDVIERHFPDVDIGYTEAEQLNQLSYVVSDTNIWEKGFDTCYLLDQGAEELPNKFRALL